MIGLNQEKIKAALIKHMGDRGVIESPEQPTTGLRFMGMANKRTKTIVLPEDEEREMSDNEVSAIVSQLGTEVEQGLRSRV